MSPTSSQYPACFFTCPCGSVVRTIRFRRQRQEGNERKGVSLSRTRQYQQSGIIQTGYPHSRPPTPSPASSLFHADETGNPPWSHCILSPTANNSNIRTDLLHFMPFVGVPYVYDTHQRLPDRHHRAASAASAQLPRLPTNHARRRHHLQGSAHPRRPCSMRTLFAGRSVSGKLGEGVRERRSRGLSAFSLYSTTAHVPACGTFYAPLSCERAAS